MGRIIGVLSGKGGVGKTVICAGLGQAISNFQKSVCLIDFDFGLNNLDLMLGIENQVVYDALDYLSGHARLRQAIVQCGDAQNLYFLSTQKIKTFSTIDQNTLMSMIKKLGEVFDFVIIDGPAGFNDTTRFMTSVCDEIMLIVTPGIASVRDASSIASELYKLNIDARLIVNRVRGDLVIKNASLNEKQIESMLNIKLVGVIPEIGAINVYSNVKPVYGVCQEAKNAFNILAKNIISNKVQLVDYSSKFKGFIGAIKRKMIENL